MMDPVVYKFPEAAKFGKVVAKNKIYQHSKVTVKIKALFKQEVEKITWAYKLSTATINLPASSEVQEIQVFAIELRTGKLSQEILQAIDRAIPSPILFELHYNEKIRYMAAYKRKSNTDKSSWVISDYFSSADYADERRLAKKALPVVLDMKALYEALLNELIPLTPHNGETLPMLVERMESIKKLEREAVKLDSRLKKAKQFNRKVELNTQLRKLKKEVETLKQ